MRKKREIDPQNRRVVSKKKKVVILLVLAAGLIGLIWFKLPFEKTYTATLSLWESGETELYGNAIDVNMQVRVQRCFFFEPKHTGTVCIGADVYSDADRDKAVHVFAPTGAFAESDSFVMICDEWHGKYLLTHCRAEVKNGRIVSVSLWDGAGNYAGKYAVQP